MKRPMQLGSLALLLVAVIAGVSAAATPSNGSDRQGAVQMQPSTAQDEAYVRVAKQLRCPVCQQLSILDSPAELAVEMRSVVRERLDAGDSEEEVLAYFVSKYGQWVLLDPPKEGFNLVVWLGPVALLLGGAVVLTRVFRDWLRSADGDDAAAPVARSRPV